MLSKGSRVQYKVLENFLLTTFYLLGWYKQSHHQLLNFQMGRRSCVASLLKEKTHALSPRIGTA